MVVKIKVSTKQAIASFVVKRNARFAIPHSFSHSLGRIRAMRVWS